MREAASSFLCVAAIAKSCEENPTQRFQIRVIL